MSNSSFKPPSSSAGSNPSLTQSRGENPAASSAGASHRLPGAFVPPSDTLSRGVPKGPRLPGTSSKSRPSTGLVWALIFGGIGVVALGAAALLLGGNSGVTVRAEGEAQGLDLGANQGALGDMLNKAPLPQWVPTYPSGAQSNLVSTIVGGQPTGTIEYKTTNSHRAVIEYYRQKIEQNQFVITSMTVMKNTGVIEAKSTDGANKIIVITEPAPEGAKANIVFTALDPDKSRPTAGGTLPKFAEHYPGTEVLEQSSRVERGFVVGHFRLASGPKPKPELESEVRKIAAFYDEKLKAAHYKIIERNDEPEYSTIEAVSRTDEETVDLYVLKKDGVIEITMKLQTKE